MKVVKLNAIDSTNNFLKDLVKNTSVESWTVITTEKQTAGKGQYKNKWLSEPSKNLTFSVLCRFINFKAEDAFYLNCVVSLAIFSVLKDNIPEGLNIKWPNDILSHGKKICGILIENTVQKGNIIRAIIGIGLNVNQEDFDGSLPHAISMKMVTNRDFDRELLLEKVINELKKQVELLEGDNFKEIIEYYEKHLYKIHVSAMYKDAKENRFMGKILGINHQGNLLVELENGSIKSFGPKEIQFL